MSTEYQRSTAALNIALPSPGVTNSVAGILRDELQPRLPASGTISTLVAGDVPLSVPTADVTTNTNERDVVGNKADTLNTTVGTTSSLMRYVKGIISLQDVVGVDSINNTYMKEVIGNKTDAAVTAVGTTKSLIAYLKGIITIFGTYSATTIIDYFNTVVACVSLPTADSSDNNSVKDVVGNKTDAAVTTVGTTKSIIAYCKGLLSLFQGSQEYLTGSGNWTVPAGVIEVDVLIVGGGGGSAGGGNVGAGGGGETVKKTHMSVKGKTTIPYVVGAGGASGEDGTASTFANISADGGKKGVTVTGGAGGTTADTNTMIERVAGAAGGGTSEAGGNTWYANGGATVATKGGGGASYGAGADGGADASANTGGGGGGNTVGGKAGGSGRILITWRL